MADKEKSKIKKLKLDSKSKTGKILIFVLVILFISISAYLYKQNISKVAEEPEVFIPLDSTKEEFLEEEKEKKIVEPKDEVIEIKDNLEDEFTLKSKYEQEILNSNDFDEFSEMGEKNEKNVPMDKYEKTEKEMEGLIKEFRQDEGFDYKSDEEIWKNSEDAFDELEKETKK